MRYFLNDNGGWLTISGDADMIGSLPDGYREVTEEEYQEAAGTIVLNPPNDGPADGEPLKRGEAG